MESPGAGAVALNQQQSNNLYLQPWMSVLNSYIETLEPQDNNTRLEVTNARDFLNAVSLLPGEFSLDASESQNLLSLVPVLDVSASSCACLINMSDHSMDFSALWGFLYVAIRLALDPENSTLEISPLPGNTENVTSFAEIAAMMKTISQKLELIKLYCEKIPSYQGMTSTTVDVHVTLLRFYNAIINCFRGTFYGQSTDQRRKQAREHYNETEKSLESAAKHIERLAWGSAISSPGDPQRGLSRLIEHEAVAQKPRVRYEKLPRRYQHFFGRKSFLQKMEEMYSNSELTAITIDGLGGVGKTQIALEFAYSQHGKRDVILWIHSERAVGMDQDISDAAMGLQLPGALPQEAAVNCLLLRDWLQTTDDSWLIIFDNVEEPELLDNIWPSRGNGSILVTARAAAISFQLATERLEVPSFDEREGPELLMSLLGKQYEGQKAAAKELAEKLGGHALAISQMAAVIKLRNMSLPSFNALYDTHREQLHRTHRRTRAAGYSHFLDTVWKLSFKYLTIAGRALLAIIALLSPESIPRRFFLLEKPRERPPVLEFCDDEMRLGEVEEQLLTLALIKKDPLEEAISIHRLIQAEFWYNLSESERQEAFNNASKLLYEQFPKQVSGRLMLDRWSICQLYIEHVLSLVYLYRSESDKRTNLHPPVEFHKLMCNAAWFLSEKGLSDELNDLLQMAFKAYDSCRDDKKDPLDYAHLCNTIGINTHNKGEFDKSRFYLQQCHDIRKESPNPDPEEMANIYNNLGNMCFSTLNYENALAWHKKADDIRMSRGDDWATAKGMTHLNTARSLWRLGRRNEAWVRLNTAIAQFTFSGNWYLLAHANLLMGTFHRESDDLTNADKHYIIAKNIMTADGHAPNQFTTSAILYKLACTALQRNEVKKAIEHLRDSLAIAELRGVAKPDLARVRHKLAEALRMQGGQDKEKEALEMDKSARQIRKDIEGDKYVDSDQSETAYDRIVCGNSR